MQPEKGQQKHGILHIHTLMMLVSKETQPNPALHLRIFSKPNHHCSETLAVSREPFPQSSN